MHQSQPIEKGDPNCMFNTIEKLKKALHDSLVVERAACLFYLSSLYCFKGKKNKAAKSLIKSVALEEMVHSIIACNLLNAVGESPSFNNVKMSFPMSFPWSISPPKVVKICEPNEEFLKIAMEIERPNFFDDSQIGFEHQVDRFTLSSLKEYLNQTKPSSSTPSFSMGMFFQEIRKSFIYLNETQPDKLWIGDPKKQISIQFSKFKRIEKVVDLKTALQSVNSVEFESEGLPMNAMGAKWLSHYYRFSEISKGQKLSYDVEKNEYFWDPDEKASKGLKLVPECIIPMTKEYTQIEDLSDENDQKIVKEFHKQYQSMMCLLDDMFNGRIEFEEDVDPKIIIESMKKLDKAGKKIGEAGIKPRYEF